MKFPKIVLAAATGVGLILAVSFAVVQKPSHSDVVRVGVDQSPPYYLIQPDGSVRGLAVDVLNEAARRGGIRLRWIPLHDLPLEDALNRRVVDLWPLVGVTPERRRSFHLTRPWIEAEYVLLSLREHPVRNPDEAAGKMVAHARLRFTTMVAKQFLSRSTFTIRPLRADAVQALCDGQAVAVLLESNALEAVMLSRPAGCEQANFRIANLTGATTPLTMAAVPEAAAPADILRAKIADMGRDGFLSARMDQWSPFSAQGTRSILAEEAANDRSRMYSYAMIAILLLSAGLAWAALRARGLRKTAERAEAGRREIQRRFTAFMDHSPALAFMKDARGHMLYVNRAWTAAFGMKPEQVYGRTEGEIWPSATAHKLRTTDEELLAENTPRQLVEQVPGGLLGTRDLLLVKFPFSNERGERFVGGTGIDITERETAIRELGASETRYRELFEHNPLPAWVYDCKTLEFLTVNKAAVETYGWTREDFLTGMTLMEVIAATDVQLRPGQCSRPGPRACPGRVLASSDQRRRAAQC